MSEPREPSYYEIALTHRQVLGVFVVLLACVVISFFAGVWVAQRGAHPEAEAAAARPPAEGEGSGSELGELRFFSESEAARPGAESPPPSPQAAEPPAPAPVAVRPEPPADGEVVVVQVFSSAEREQAQKVVDRLRSAQLPAILSPVEVGERTMYRVRVGPYREREEAEAVAERVRREFKLDTWITQ